MDKQILNAIAEVLKDERERFSSEIDRVENSITDHEKELERIERSVKEFSDFVAAKEEHDSSLAAELEQIQESIGSKLDEKDQKLLLSEIDRVVSSIPDYEKELIDIEKSIEDFSRFVKAKDEHDSKLALELEKIHEDIANSAECNSSVISELKKWADDFELKKEFERIQIQEEFEEIKSFALSLKDGEKGEDGKDGRDGQDGKDGRDGVDNPAIAPISIDRDFKANKGLVVYHRGGLWQAIRNTNGDPEVDSGNWRCFVDGVNNVSSSFDAKNAVYNIDFEKTNGTKETLTFERPPAYLPPGDHKSVDGDYFLDETCLNVYVDGTWLAKDLKGEKGEKGKDGNRGRVGKRGVGIEDIIPVKNGWKVLLTNGETKDLYLDILDNGKEDIDQEIKRYAGFWHSSKSYVTGDVVTLTNSLFLCLSNTSDSPESSDSWVQMVSPASGGTFLSSDGDTGAGGPLPDFVLVTESGKGGTKLSSFKDSVSAAIKFIGVDENNKDVKARITTDMLGVNPTQFRNPKNGQFIGTPEELENIKNQRDYNEWVYKTLNEIEAGDVNLDGYATTEQLTAVEDASIFRDETIKNDLEETDKKQTAAILVVEADVQNEAAKRQQEDQKLQDQIDNLAAGEIDLSPVENRLDDIEEVLPKAPIVIPPVEIGSGKVLIDHPTRPSGADKPPEGELWMWHMDADRTGNPANEMKTTVASEYQGNVIIDGINAVWFKQGDRVQKWNTANGGWWTGGNLWHLSASSTEGDTLVDGQPFEIYYVDPNAQGDDLIDAISRLESKADDRKLQAEIEQIALGLETLLQQREAGKWTYKGAIADGIPSKPGEFSLGSDDLSASGNIIILNQTDLDDKFHGFGDVDVGDYVEIVDLDKPDEYALFVIDSEPDGDGIVSFNLKLKDKGNNFLVGTTCEIRFFAINEQNLDITELDQRYLKLTGGTMKGDLNLSGNGASIGWTDDQGQNWIQFKFGSTTEYKGWYSTDDAIATRKRVNEAVEGLASEEWVTEQIESVDIPETDLTGYATEQYVDQKVYQSKFLPGQQVAKTDGSSSNTTGAFWIVDGALYCKVS